MSKTPSKLVPCEAPGKASAEGTVVLLDGPDGVAVAMTAEAAALTADSLRQAAEQALAAAGHPGEDGGLDNTDGSGGATRDGRQPR